jgi:hypothetical protein
VATVTWEEASKCPRCESPGREVKTVPIPYRVGAEGHILVCTNRDRCSWGQDGTRWLVQVNPNGTIPVNEPGPKSFPAIPKISDEDLERRLRDLENEPKRGGEIRNPWSG